MGRSPIRDLLVGVFVLSGLAALAYLSIQLGGATYSGPGGLTLYASFDEIGGLAPRSPVVIGGVKVGQVKSIELSPDRRLPRARPDRRRQALKLPDDTAASILTQGVLGSQYIGLEPGGSDTMLADGGEIAYTQSAVVIERLIGRVIQSLGNCSSSGASTESSPDAGGGEATAGESRQASARDRVPRRRASAPARRREGPGRAASRSVAAVEPRHVHGQRHARPAG